MRRRFPISRRTFLRGAGAAIALPFLDAMKPLRAASTARPPVRFAVLFFPNGVWKPGWIPKETGADYELPFALSPIQKLKSEVLVLSGLDKAQSRDGDGHYAKTANFLTGLKVVRTTGKEISVGSISVDQLIASKIGQQTPLPSLELGIDPVVSGIDTFVGYTRLYGSHISWRAASLTLWMVRSHRCSLRSLKRRTSCASRPKDLIVVVPATRSWTSPERLSRVSWISAEWSTSVATELSPPRNAISSFS